MRDDLSYPNLSHIYLAFYMRIWDNINGYGKEVINIAMTKQKCKKDCIIMNTLNELVPKEHLVRKLDNCIDL